MDESKSDVEDDSDSEFLAQCQRELEQKQVMTSESTWEEERRNVEKRKEREDDNSAEDDFITVDRRKSKRLVRSESIEMQDNKRVDQNKNQNDHLDDVIMHEVCVTSMECLPKQMALAKLLKSENIKGIIRIKYKSFNKVLIKFKEDEDAIKLLDCLKLKEMGFRCQKVNELSLSYGIVKGVDIELSDKELQDIIKSPTEIMSINRLKRLSAEGKWIDSESVRVCFKGNALPPYIYAYDCRFKVEAYVFPVTQCSGCWQFGHIFKFCPTKKKLCPKCGGNHDNCDVKEFKCLNCKGPHLVLDKSCPLYFKERQIRIIMSQEQVPYRRALQLFIEKRERTECLSPILHNSSIATSTARGIEMYSKVVAKATVHREPRAVDVNFMDCPNEAVVEPTSVFHHSKARNNKQRTEVTQSFTEHLVEEKHGKTQREEIDNGTKEDEQLRYRFEFKKLFLKMKCIFMSEDKVEDKIGLILKMIWEEFRKILVLMFSKGEYIEKIFSFING